MFHSSGNNQIFQRNDYLNSTGAGVVIRNPNAYSILDKVVQVEGNYFEDTNKNFSGLVSPKHFFDNSILLTSKTNT